MPRYWVKFNVFFESLDDDDPDELFDKVVDAMSTVIDPACANLDWEALEDGQPPPDHHCTRDWTAGSCSVPALPEDEVSEDNFDATMNIMDEAMCNFCGRPFPDASHRVERFVSKAVK